MEIVIIWCNRCLNLQTAVDKLDNDTIIPRRILAYTCTLYEEENTPMFVLGLLKVESFNCLNVNRERICVAIQQ